eukprot:12194998-Ditylum_brightwellii.AAC.1
MVKLPRLIVAVPTPSAGTHILSARTTYEPYVGQKLEKQPMSMSIWHVAPLSAAPCDRCQGDTA